MKSLLGIFMLILNTRQECLSKEALIGLGFTEAEIFDAPKKDVESDVCVKLFEREGSCVDVDRLK